LINSNYAVLVLEDGRLFRGNSWGAEGLTFGELVFATPMTGYQETITDPSYCGQILVQTAPHIGNTGMNDEDAESDRIWISGYVVRDPSRISSNWRSNRDLLSDLEYQKIVGICNVDTRAITRHLRDRGAMRAGIFSGTHIKSDEEMVALVNNQPSMKGRNLTEEVSTKSQYIVPANGKVQYRVAAIDLGIKRNTPRLFAKRNIETHVVPANGKVQYRVAAIDLGIKRNTPRLFAKRNIETHVVPANTNVSELIGGKYDGIFLSNGPGDPATAKEIIEKIKQVLEQHVPLFGICFGHQLFGPPLGLETYKLQFGHRGINQPVQDLISEKVAITAHNHGFAVAAPDNNVFSTPFGDGKVTHRCLNDGVVEGLELTSVPAFSVQYHPEAAAGPHDAEYLFDKFLGLLQR